MEPLERAGNFELAGEDATLLGPGMCVGEKALDFNVQAPEWRGAIGVDKLCVRSDQLNAGFGVKYGSLKKERRILRRAVFTADRQDVVVFPAYAPALSDEPHYDAILEVALSKQALLG